MCFSCTPAPAPLIYLFPPNPRRSLANLVLLPHVIACALFLFFTALSMHGCYNSQVI